MKLRLLRSLWRSITGWFNQPKAVKETIRPVGGDEYLFDIENNLYVELCNLQYQQLAQLDISLPRLETCPTKLAENSTGLKSQLIINFNLQINSVKI